MNGPGTNEMTKMHLLQTSRTLEEVTRGDSGFLILFPWGGGWSSSVFLEGLLKVLIWIAITSFAVFHLEMAHLYTKKGIT